MGKRVAIFITLASNLLLASYAYAQNFRDVQPVPSSIVPGEARIALVIGNRTYEHISDLQNPVNDAEDMTAALQQRGFEVITGTDLNGEKMEEAITEFVSRIGSQSIALFYYAGHGLGHEGDNYLIPTDADITSRTQIRFRAVNATEVLHRVEEKGARFSMIFLDACRDAPFRNFRSDSGGWATMQGEGGALIAYGTAPGSQASDNSSGRNGLFTGALLQHIHSQGIEVMAMLRRVSGDVLAASSRLQRPWLASSYSGAFYFAPGQVEAPIPQPEPVNQLAQTRTVDLGSNIQMQFQLIRAGSFQMGSLSGNADENPVREVTISKPFYMGRTEVTQAQYTAVMGNNPSEPKGASLPVTHVSWSDAQAFMSKLNERENCAGCYRLPTEAEWEYACRAGSESAYGHGDDVQSLSDFAWYRDNSNRQSHPVGTKQANAWLLHDMSGNVWEWVSDYYDAAYYGTGVNQDPTGPEDGSTRFVRGGSWLYYDYGARCAFRGWDLPSGRSYDVGFRVVLFP